MCVCVCERETHTHTVLPPLLGTDRGLRARSAVCLHTCAFVAAESVKCYAALAVTVALHKYWCSAVLPFSGIFVSATVI